MTEEQPDLITVPQKSGASLSRGTSEQVVATPQSFVDACARKWGPITWDLAATKQNKKAPRYYGRVHDSLIQRWHRLRGVLFLNPEYAKIGPWAEKCWHESRLGARILMLVPASVGSNWYRDFVFKKACSVYINGRIQFVGHKDAYPKDLMICAYGFYRAPFEIWTPAKNELL